MSSGRLRIPAHSIAVWRAVCSFVAPVSLQQLRHEADVREAMARGHVTLQRVMTGLVADGYLACRSGRHEWLDTYWFGPECRAPHGETAPAPYVREMGKVAAARTIAPKWEPHVPSYESRQIAAQMERDRQFRRSRMGDKVYLPDGRVKDAAEPHTDFGGL